MSKLVAGQRVRVYYNIRRGRLSVMDKKTRLVVSREDSVELANVRFIVSRKGLERIRATKRKAVIAFVEGDLVSTGYGAKGKRKGWSRAYFNPYIVDQFVVGEEPIYEADRVRIEDKNVYVNKKEK